MQLQDIRDQLLQRARALGLEGDSEEALLDALLEREVEVPAPAEVECRQYFEQHPELFRTGGLIEADHILFAVTEGVPLAALRERAQQVLDAVLAEPDRFAALAGEFSNCPSAQVGGSLGQLSRTGVVPEFWVALERAGRPGVIRQLVETRYGLHIVRIHRIETGQSLPFETVEAEIRARLERRNVRRALREYAHGLLHAAESDAH